MKKYIVVDIDGTISEVGERLKYLNQDPPDWDKFYNDCFDDEPILNIINLVEILSDFYEIIFCTGRRESVRTLTTEWLEDNLNIEFPVSLLMRRNNDKRHDIKTKPELLSAYGIELSDIEFVLEDRNSMVNRWRELGLVCLQVRDGNF